jgi:hypothetical protein
MCVDRSDLYRSLAPTAQKITLLAKLAPVCETDRELVDTLGLILRMVGDYSNSLYETLQDPSQGEDRP